MSQGDKFKFFTPTLGIMFEDGHRFPVTVPKNATIEVMSGLNPERMVNIDWEGRVVMMFAQDIRERAQTITR